MQIITQSLIRRHALASSLLNHIASGSSKVNTLPEYLVTVHSLPCRCKIHEDNRSATTTACPIPFLGACLAVGTRMPFK